MKKLLTENKSVLFISIGLLLLLIGWFYYSKSYEKEINPEKNFDNINTNMNLEKGKEIYENKIDAYTQEIKDSIELAQKNKNVNLDFEMNTDVALSKENQIQKKLDSILNKHQSQYLATPTNSTDERSSNNVVVPKRVEKTIDNKKMNDFFNNQPSENQSELKKEIPPSNAFIYASINGNQTIEKNGRVEVILNKEALIYGKIYSKNTFLYGVAKFGVNRVFLDILNINHIPVDLKAYDAQDGNLGIYIEAESLAAEAFSESTDDITQQINVKGIPVGQTIKSLFRKKKNIQKVTLLNNYKLILKTKN